MSMPRPDFGALSFQRIFRPRKTFTSVQPPNLPVQYTIREQPHHRTPLRIRYLVGLLSTRISPRASARPTPRCRTSMSSSLASMHKVLSDRHRTQNLQSGRMHSNSNTNLPPSPRRSSRRQSRHRTQSTPPTLSARRSRHRLLERLYQTRPARPVC